MGLPHVRYADGTEISPQIDLRKALRRSLPASARCASPRAAARRLNLPAGKSVDFVLIRESTEGLFYTQGSGEVTQDEARETLRITRDSHRKTVPLCLRSGRVTARRPGAATGG